MRLVLGFLLVAIATCVLSNETRGQQRQEFCGEEWVFTEIPSNLNRQISVIYGRVSLEGAKEAGKPFKIVVRLRDGQNAKQHSLSGSGTYCFERSGGGIAGSNGEITVDVNGEQVESRSLIPNQPEQREDFKIRVSPKQNSSPPGVVSAKFNYTRNDKNAKLFERATRAAAEAKLGEAIAHLTEIVKADPADYIAAATVGGIFYQQGKYPDAEIWFKRSVAANPEFAPAWLSLSRAQYAQKNYDAAIESGNRLIKLEPNSPAAYYIIGESYLRSERANLAVVALNEAIKLDPVGMAECHLILADLYDFNGAKKMAAIEYKAFLAKVPKHPNIKAIEQYIKDNPE